MNFGANDRYWMRRALALARRGLGTTSPNPMVGAIVLDEDGRLAAAGYHHKAGEAHAEALALRQAGRKARNGTLYVNLEPCCHQGRTPPCSKEIISSGIRRVVVAMCDPNPKMNGRGLEELRQRGVIVDVGCLEEMAERLNLTFIRWITRGSPIVIAKVAISEDLKIGARGICVRITANIAERSVMKLRASCDAILVGGGTLRNDDPKLTVRGEYADRKPIRAIVDGQLDVSPKAQVFSSAGGPIWIFTSESASTSPTSLQLQERGARLIALPSDSSKRVNPADILGYFAQHSVTSVLVEGGPTLLSRFTAANLVDHWVLYQSPRSLGPSVEGFETVGFDPNQLGNFKLVKECFRGVDRLRIYARR